MSEEKLFFVIEEHKWSYPNVHFKYNIMKDKAFPLAEATKMLLAYEQLNDNENVKYHIQEVDLMLGDSKKTILEKKEEEDDRISF
tara:strand:+ start:236 stop:490 length:255 start_codon:yes stop_codon:yes gene_type:complete